MKTVLGAASAVLLLLAGCAAAIVSTSRSVPTRLVSSEYNSIAARYMERPTFTKVQLMKDGSKVLVVSMDSYDPSGSGQRTLWFYSKDCPRYIAAIDKYLEWEAKATARGDVFDKQIAVIPLPLGSNLGFTFHSGNPTHDFLSIGYSNNTLLGKIDVAMLMLDKNNALVLRELLTQLPTMDASPVADDYK